MKPKHILAIATLFIMSHGGARADKSIEEAGVMVCVNDKWDEKELKKGHKIVNYAGPCVSIPDDPAAEKFVEDCVGKYEFMPDESWKGSGTCTLNFKDGQVSATWEEGSHLKEYIYMYTGGHGKYTGAGGSGTYKTEALTDRFMGGRYKGFMKLP